MTWVIYYLHKTSWKTQRKFSWELLYLRNCASGFSKVKETPLPSSEAPSTLMSKWLIRFEGQDRIHVVTNFIFITQQILIECHITRYCRMLWGKKINQINSNFVGHALSYMHEAYNTACMCMCKDIFLLVYSLLESYRKGWLQAFSDIKKAALIKT